jgi:fermentation-respiration switch protein FrsA (DUF1100 family)
MDRDHAVVLYEYAAAELCRGDHHPTLIVTGENAHSRYFAEDAFKAVGSKQKELVIVPGANHVDLYDNVAGKIPFAQFGQFFKTSLN